MAEISQILMDGSGSDYATRFNGGRLQILEDATVRAEFNPITAVNTSGSITISGSNADVATSTVAGVNGFVIRNSSNQVLLSGTNRSYSVAPGDQSAAANTLTITGHGLVTGQTVKLSGDLPTTNPPVNSVNPLHVRVVDVDTIQLLAEKGGGVISITGAASGNTTVTKTPLEISDNTAGIAALVKLQQSGLSLTAGNSLGFDSFVWTVPNRVEAAIA